MKQYVSALFASIAFNSMAYGMNSDIDNQLFRDHSSPIISRVELPTDIDFGVVIDVSQSLVKGCYKDIFKPATDGFIIASKRAAPFVFSYVVACFIDPKPHNNK